MKNVLIIEDEALHMEKILEAFEGYQQKFDIHKAESIKAAYRFLNTNSPDIVITDHFLPDGEGREIIQRTKDDCPIILMTAYGNEQLAVKAMKDGFMDYLIKLPENIQQLPQTIEWSIREWKLVKEKEQLKEELTKREQKYRNLFEESNDAVFVHDAKGKIRDVNARASEMLGCTKESLFGTYVFNLHPSKSLSKAHESIENTLEKGSHRFESLFLAKDGRELNVEISARIFDHQNQLIQGIVRDITQRKESEKQLTEQNEKYKKLINNSLAGIGITDLNENFTFVNDTFAGLLGYEKAEMTGMNLSNLTTAESYRFFREETYKRIQDQSSIYETILYKKEGSPLHVLVHSSPYKNAQKETIGTIAVVVDITDRKKAEERVKQSEIFNREVINNLGQGVVVYDKELRYRLWNPFMEKITGKKEKEVLGKSVEIFPHLKKYGLDQLMKKALKGEQVRTPDTPFEVPKTGKKGWVSGLYSPHYDALGNIMGIIAIISDITVRKEDEQKLHEMNLMKDHLFSIIGHDLRNPVSDILGFSRLLMENAHNYNQEKTEKFQEYIYSSAKSLFDLLENLLEWSRIHRDKKPFNPETFNLKPLVESTSQAVSPKARQKNIRLENLIPDSLVVFADLKMIQTVIRNILFNALKFTSDKGQVKIEAIQTDRKVKVSICDNGVGMSEEQQKKLFNFRQVDSLDGFSGEKGSGIGLMLCKELIEKHEQEIWMDSKEGKGTCIHFTLKMMNNQ